MSLDCMGLDFSSFGDIFKSTGELVKGGAELYEKEQAAKKSSADDKKSLDDAIAKDITASKAVAVAAMSAATAADKESAKFALSLQDKAGEKLSGDSQSKRADAADKALGEAMAKWKASPKDEFAAALVKAWQATSTKAHGGAIVAKGDESESKSAKRSRGDDDSGSGIMSLLRKKVVGPVPVWGVGLGGIAAIVIGRKYIGKN